MLLEGRHPPELSMVRQMQGRAGRKGQSDVGEAFLVCSRGKLRAAAALVHAPLPQIDSRLLAPRALAAPAAPPGAAGAGAGAPAGPAAAAAAAAAAARLDDATAPLQRLLLAAVATGAVADAPGVERLLRCTLAARRRPWADVARAAVAALRVLSGAKGLIEVHGPGGSLWRCVSVCWRLCANTRRFLCCCATFSSQPTHNRPARPAP
jgi:hypothetical protein